MLYSGSSRTREVSIAANPTVSDGQQAKAVAPLASERLALMGQVAGAKIELDRLIVSMQDSRTSLPAEITGQQAELAGLISQIAAAHAADLPALQRAVATAVAEVANAARQMQANASAQSGAALQPAERARAAIEAVGRDLFDKHVLDDYLAFDSKIDEEAYRKRERENAEALKRALALHTPEGDRRAVEIEQRQLADAGAHGATASPDYARLVGLVDQAGKDLDNAALQRAEQPVEAPTKISPPTDAPPSEQEIASLSAALRLSGVVASTALNSEPQHGLSENNPTDVRAPQMGRS